MISTYQTLKKRIEQLEIELMREKIAYDKSQSEMNYKKIKATKKVLDLNINLFNALTSPEVDSTYYH